jgi:hypothetical protein
MASLATVEHRNDATVYVRVIWSSVYGRTAHGTLWSAGRVQLVYMPKDKLSGVHNGTALSNTWPCRMRTA